MNPNLPTGETMEGGDYSGAESESKDISINPGIPASKGDKLTFCVTGDPDEDGNVTGYFETGESDGADESEQWEKDFRKSFSARNPNEGVTT